MESAGCNMSPPTPTVVVVPLGPLPAAYRHKPLVRLNRIAVVKGPTTATAVTDFVPSLGIEVTATGPLASKVMGTLTRSPRAVVLGPVQRQPCRRRGSGCLSPPSGSPCRPRGS